MGGALLDLVAKGGQDVYLICNPQMSFFKKVYRRHTNFAVEYQKYELDANLDFGKATTFTLPRKGDLIKNIFLQFHLPELTSPNDVLYSYTNYIGYALIEYIEIYINTQKIDRITGEWLYIYHELFVPEDKKRGYNQMVGGKNFIGYNSYIGNDGGVYIVPLNFWFNQDISSSIPYTALQYSDIDIKIKLRDFNDLWITKDGNPPIGNYKLEKVEMSIESVYLDVKERKEFSTQSHEYLIKQVQYNINNHIIAGTKSKTFNLSFNHPVTELILVVQTKSKLQTGPDNSKDFFNFSLNDSHPLNDTIKNAKILLNGSDRTPEMTAIELRTYNPIQYHTSIPNNFIYVFPFSLNPEDYQPSGSSNFSRFDIKQLQVEFADNIPNSEVKIYAVNYNILRITQGLGGLAYIN